MSEKNKTTNPLSDDTLLTFMQYYQEEFMFRHKHYWDILIKLFVFDVIILILPITTEVMGISLSEGKNTYALIFPCFGLLIAILTRIILKDEAKKISAVNKAKYDINDKLPSLLQYYTYVNDKSNKKVQLAHHLVNIVFGIEVLMCIIVFVIIL